MHYRHWDAYFKHPEPDVGGIPVKVSAIPQDKVCDLEHSQYFKIICKILFI